MTCHKCGANNKEEARFCTTCGSELLIPTKEEEREAEEKKKKDNSYSTKSLVIGVCTCAFSGFFGILMLPFSIWGIKLGIKSKNTQQGIAGLIINIVNVFIQLFATFILLPLIIFIFKDAFNSDRYAYKYICSDYGEVEITDNIIFELNKDKTFTLSYDYPDGSGIIKGKYSVQSVESTVNDEYTKHKYTIKLNADTRVIDNELIEGDYQTKYKLTIENNEITLENKISKNKYSCKKAN